MAPRFLARCSAAPPLIAVASAQPVSADALNLLIPAGAFRPRDGRALSVDAWVLDAAGAQRVIAAFRARSVQLPVDYEHQILAAPENGKPAPAAGWIADLEWDATRGLLARVVWTAAARAAIEAEEYRYWSPVFSYDSSGHVLQVLHAGLTNTPALDLPALTLRAAARYTTGAPTVDLAKLRELLGLAADADEAAVLAALTKLKAQADDAETAVAAARAQAVDPARYVPIAVVTDLQTQVAALRAEQTNGQVAALVDAGVADGRILPAMREWATDLGRSNVAALRAYLDKAQPIAALVGTQTQGAPPATVGDTGLTTDELAVCRATGVEPSAFKAQKAAGGAT